MGLAKLTSLLNTNFMTRIKITVHGLVQGVGFRYHTRRKALQLGLTGYVKNKSDGTVEIVADGTSELLQELIDWAQVGSPKAQVDRLEIQEQLAINDLEAFAIEYE
jgi:acylphosphatase